MKIKVVSLDEEIELELEAIPEIVAASCSEIHVGSALDKIELKARPIVVDELVSKLRYGGVIHFNGVDIYQLAHALVFGNIPVSTLVAAIFADDNKSATALSSLINLVESRGLEVLTSNIYLDRYVLSARRPNA